MWSELSEMGKDKEWKAAHHSPKFIKTLSLYHNSEPHYPNFSVVIPDKIDVAKDYHFGDFPALFYALFCTRYRIGEHGLSSWIYKQ